MFLVLFLLSFGYFFVAFCPFCLFLLSLECDKKLAFVLRKTDNDDILYFLSFACSLCSFSPIFMFLI